MKKKEVAISILVILGILIITTLTLAIGLLENNTWEQNLTAVRYTALSLGDLDNDGNYELILTGCLTDGADDCENG